LAIGHAVNDFYALMLSWLLPDFEAAFGLSHTMAMSVVAVAGIFNSMTQPALGYVSEQTGGRKYYIIVGTFLAGAMSLVGLAPNVWVFIGIAIAASMGVGLFHPNGAAEVFKAVGPRDKIGRSLFAVAGGVGIALGPPIVMRIVNCHGLRGTWLLFPPAIILPLCFLWTLPSSRARAGGKEGAPTPAPAKPGHLAIVIVLFVAVVLRSTSYAGVNSLVPLRCEELGYSRLTRGYVMSLMAIFATMGGLLGGYLAGKIGSKPIMLCSCFLSAPLLYGFVARESWFLLGASAFLMTFAMPHFVMAAQDLMPESAGTVSGFMMGMAWSISSLILPLFGKISDMENVGFAIKLLAILPIPAGILVLFIKRSALDFGTFDEGTAK